MEFADEILMASIKKDDYACYNQLFMRYYSRLCAFVFTFTQNYSASEEIDLNIDAVMKQNDGY